MGTQKARRRAAPALFKAWMKERALTLAAAARLLECTPEHVGYLLSGARAPGLALAFRIERVTAEWARGPIDAEEWVTPKPAKQTAA
jgi:plasmid maintenance system antidote protein VapI